MNRIHKYAATIKWTGNKGTGTEGYDKYDRDHTISVENKAAILASSDPKFRGDKRRYNPEELLLASLSSCHMLWYLHLCSDAGVVVVKYTDEAQGTMSETENGGGKFTEVTLNPVVIVREASMTEKAGELHAKANRLCFIANSVNFPVKHNPTIKVLNIT